jgi:hypothetical protein
MSRAKVSRRPTSKEDKRRKEWPAVVYFWAIGLAFVSYIVARIVLDSYPHPYHWLSGLVGGVLGIPLGWLWYRWRGDIF